MLLFPLLLLLLLFTSAHASSAAVVEEEDHGVEPAMAVLFPWFSEVLGVVTVYVLTRYFHALPFTAIMFVIGTFLGVALVENTEADGDTNKLQQSVTQWATIDGELLLLVFLPGLLFVDAFHVNFHLFQVSFWQLLIMAFPMVLAGTVLTALVGYYVLPYDWSWNLAMTFGSILAATDPVAVSALLNEVGAPPRLKMHVSGESMLNDGSAVVFFTIFGASFLHELENLGLGEDINGAEGVKIFFRMSLGGAAIGMAFGLGLMLILFLLHRRLDKEENVLQVAVTITIAYLSFFVAEIVCHTSGVIAVVSCGITTQAFGSNMINDQHMMESFWELVEYLLNTLLFTLGK
jgi:NhaP-type Na+/H+ or K+/H+ antiporter